MNLCCFGLGYSSEYIIDLIKLNYKNYNIIATKRDSSKKYENVKIIAFNEFAKIPEDTTHVLISIPPIEQKDIVFERFSDQIPNLPNLKWLGYLSATNVYGDHQGEWVDEKSKTNPSNERAISRLKAEENWLSLYKKYNVPIVIFRLAGIYGKGRNQLERILNHQDVQVIEAKGKFFSRIHVEDIAEIVLKSIENPTPGEIFNVADDLACESSELTEYAYKLLHIPAPEAIKLENANLSPMGREFYADNKKICNKKIKKILNVKLKYPTYIEGLLKIK